MKIGVTRNPIAVTYQTDPTTGRLTESGDETAMQNFHENSISEIHSQFQTKKDNHKITVSFHYMGTGDMARIYAARNAGSVRGVIYGVNAQMRKAQASGAQASQINSAVSKMKQVLRKAGSKLNRLGRESKLEQQARAAQRMRREKAVKRYAEQLQRKRRARKAQEYCEILDPRDLLDASSTSYAVAENTIPETAYSAPCIQAAPISPGTAAVEGETGALSGASLNILA